MIYEIYDLTFLQGQCEKYHLKRELLSQCREEFTVLHWKSAETRPEEASYILIKYLDAELKMVVCLPGCYEQGKYSELTAPVSETLDERYVISWCYFPYDGRENNEKIEEVTQ